MGKMKKSSAFLEYITSDMLGDYPGIKARAMFGGWTLYKDGIIFGLIDDDKLFFKTGEGNIKDFEEIHAKPFTYSKDGKEYQMKYHEVPEEIIENRELLTEWLEKAVTVSIQSKVK